MKVIVIDGLLKKETEMRKMLDLVVKEFEKKNVSCEVVRLNEITLDVFENEPVEMMDALVNRVLISDAIVLATSVHMNNISTYTKNFLEYFTLLKYQIAIKDKIVFPFVMHEGVGEIDAYSMIMNVIKNFNMFEINNLILEVPEDMDVDFLDASLKYIKIRSHEFCNMLGETKEEVKSSDPILEQVMNPESIEKAIEDSKKMELVEDAVPEEISFVSQKSNTNIQENLSDVIASANDNYSVKADVNKLLENQKYEGMDKLAEAEEIRKLLDPRENQTKKDLKELAEMVNEKIKDETLDIDSDKTQMSEKIELPKVQAQVDESKDEILKDLTKTYKTKIEQIMQETLFDDEDAETPENVEVSKFEFDNFKEVHEVVPYENENKTEEKKEKVNSLKDMTKNLIYLFKAPENETVNVLVQLNVSGEEEMKLYINIENNRCSIFEGININSNITIDVASDKWRKILQGEITLQKAFMTGIIKVIGNFMFLAKLDKTLLAYTDNN